MNSVKSFSKQIILHTLLPLLMGGLIYIAYRDKCLLLFQWIQSLGFSFYINILSSFFKFYKQNIPNWIIYSIPNALWTYSLTMFMIIIWDKKVTKVNILWILIGPIISIFAEIGQEFSLMPGTFDVTDIYLCFLASLLAFLQLTINDNFIRNEATH